MSHPIVRSFLPSFAAVLLLGMIVWWLLGGPAAPSGTASAPAAPAPAEKATAPLKAP